MSGASTVCPHCGDPVPGEANFCEGCGARLGEVGEAAATEPLTDPAWESAPVSGLTTPLKSLGEPTGPLGCAECGGEVGSDGYCLTCGVKAASARDHFREEPAGWVAGVCDRGIRHPRNEDAMALLATSTPGRRAVLVVCDGVSSSEDSDVASLAAARAAREVLRSPLPQGMGTPQSRAAAAARLLDAAASAANDAIVALTDPDSPNPASATFTVAVLEGRTVWHANIGDSRSYWLPDTGSPVLLTEDHSAAQQQISAGTPRAVAEASPAAHAITRWLGRDSEDLHPTVGSSTLEGAGWLLTCSDGLWNYASSPSALAARLHGTGETQPARAALALVAWAKEQGGQDNITVALARVDPTPAPTTGAAAPGEEE